MWYKKRFSNRHISGLIVLDSLRYLHNRLMFIEANIVRIIFTFHLGFVYGEQLAREDGYNIGDIFAVSRKPTSHSMIYSV